MRACVIATRFGLSLFMAACAAPSQGATTATRSGPFIAPDLPALAGKLATCAGPRRETFDLEAREVTLDLGSIPFRLEGRG